MDAVIICGHYDDKTGYSKFRRELGLALSDLGVAVQFRPGPASRLPPLDSPSVDRARKLTGEVGARYAVHIDTPDRVALLPDVVNVLFTQVEADRIPVRWESNSQRADLIVVPSASSEAAWIRAGISRDKLRRCTQGVQADLFTWPLPSPRLLALNTRGRPFGAYRTRFLNVSDTTTGMRENLGGLLGTWISATSADDDAVLALKWYHPGGLDGAGELFDRAVSNVERVLGRSARDAAPMELITEWLSEEEMPGLYAACTHYLSVSNGEGWDLPMAEAGAAGLQLIAPDHSAYRAYLNETIATLIPSTPAPIPQSGWQGGDASDLDLGIHWWQPDLDAAQMAIKDAVHIRDRWRSSARETILRDYSWERAGERLLAILQDDAKQREMSLSGVNQYVRVD